MQETERVLGTCYAAACQQLFGKYELSKLLGCGAFAKVYHARDVATGKSIAVKVINKKKIFGTSLMSNIKREISIMRQLRHPHIVKLFEVLATKTKIYFVLEFVKGGELFARIAKRGRFSEDLSRKYFQQLISALEYCHSRGIFHRDLKPENLLVDENGDLKVSDFGLGALNDQIRPDSLLHTLCGTPAYVAPEILSKRGYDGSKVDIWSCGVVLFVLSSWFLPFNDPNSMAMYKKIYKGEYRCPKWMSLDLKHLFARVLDTNPETRITIDEITRNAWFIKGGSKFYYKDDQLKFYTNYYEEKKDYKDTSSSSSTLNAFDIISFSSGLNLSGLFDDDESYTNSTVGSGSERLVLAESPEKIIEKVEEVGMEENALVKKRMKEKMWGVDLGGQNGNFVVGVEVYRLTETLACVEVKQRRSAAKAGEYKLWREKIKSSLLQAGI